MANGPSCMSVSETPNASVDLKASRSRLNMGRPPVYDRAALAPRGGQGTAWRGAGRPTGGSASTTRGSNGRTAPRIPISIDARPACRTRADPCGRGRCFIPWPPWWTNTEMGITDEVRGLRTNVTNTCDPDPDIAALGGAVPRLPTISADRTQGEPCRSGLGTLHLRDLRARGNRPPCGSVAEWRASLLAAGGTARERWPKVDRGSISAPSLGADKVRQRGPWCR